MVFLQNFAATLLGRHISAGGMRTLLRSLNVRDWEMASWAREAPRYHKHIKTETNEDSVVAKAACREGLRQNEGVGRHGGFIRKRQKQSAQNDYKS